MTEALDRIIKREVKKATRETTNSDFPAFAVHGDRIYVPRMMGKIDDCLAEISAMSNNPAYGGYSFRFGPDIDVDKTEASEKVYFKRRPRAALWVSPPNNRNFEYFVIEDIK